MILFWTVILASFSFFVIPSVSTESDMILPLEVIEDMESGESGLNEQGMMKSRVKKGGAFDSTLLALPSAKSKSESQQESAESESQPQPDLESGPEGNLQEKEKRRLNLKSHLNFNTFSIYYPQKAKTHKGHKAKAKGKSRRPLIHSTRESLSSIPQDENNRFYYFNEDLPATRVHQSYDPLIKLPNGDSQMDSPPKISPSKRNTDLHSKSESNQSLWKPILVQTKYGPFHLHFPILTDLTHSKLDVQDILHEATKYKNPLDFGFASVPFQHEAQVEAHQLIRKRRGLGNWLKKVLHLNKKTTTRKPTTTTTTSDWTIFRDDDRNTQNGPNPILKNDEDYNFYDDDDGDFKGNNRKNDKGEREMRKKALYHPDQHGDTETDWLLPKSLRKSSILARLHGVNDDNANNRFYTDHTRQPVRSPTITRSNTKPGRRRNSQQRKNTNNNGKNWNGNGNSEEFPGTSSYDKQTTKPSRMNSRNHLPPSQTPFHDSSSNSENSGRRKLEKKPGETLGMFNENPRSEYGETEYDSTEDSFLEDVEIEKTSTRKMRVPKKPRQRQKRSILEPERKSTLQTQNVNVNVNNKNSQLLKYTLPSVPITKISLSTGNHKEPFSTASKEELRLLHELFITIVNGKCPRNFESQFVELFEMNLFKIIDSTHWPTTTEETSSDMSTLIHQLVNCSIKVEVEKDALAMLLLQEKYSNYHNLPNEIEIGGPLYRSKRGRMGQNSLNYNLDSDSTKAQEFLQLQISNFEFALISFISEECGHCVSRELLYSAAQLILEAIQEEKYVTFIPIPDEMILRNLNIIQNCANLIVKHREGEKRLKRKLKMYLKKFPTAIPFSSNSLPAPVPKPKPPIHTPTLYGFHGIENDYRDMIMVQRRPERKASISIPKEITETYPVFSSLQNTGLDSIFHEFPVFQNDEWEHRK